MTDKTGIQPGDLVMVVRGHVCMLNAIGGAPFVVDQIWDSYGRAFSCPECNHQVVAPAGLFANHPIYRVPLPWLKKLNPPALPEEIDEEREALV